MLRRAIPLISTVLALLALSGCTDVVTAPVDVAATAVETGADVTGEAVETTADVVTP